MKSKSLLFDGVVNVYWLSLELSSDVLQSGSPQRQLSGLAAADKSLSPRVALPASAKRESVQIGKLFFVRFLVESSFNRVTHYRRMARRCQKTAPDYFGPVCLAWPLAAIL